MKKVLLFVIICALGLFGSVRAQGNLSIVEMGADQNPDAGSNYYLPVYDYSPYSISQQIYTAEEFGDNMGAIMTVGFKLGNTTYVQTRTYEVYLKSTELSEFNGTSYISLTADDKVFDGDVEISGEMDSWFTITLDKSFNYTGGNVVLAVYDKTGLTGSYHYFYKYAATGRSLYSKGNYSYDMLGLGVGLTRSYVSQVQFGMVTDPTVAVTAESIELGNVKVGNYWAEESCVKSATFNAQAVATTFTSISCDNDFFTLDYDLTANPVAVKVGYDKTAEAGEQTATITIKANNVEDITIPVTATAYTPVATDVYELAQEITFTAASYADTPEFANLKDDYNLPREVKKGSTPDAVYSFELEEEVTVVVNVTGTNAVAAIYGEDFKGEGGPKANNSDNGNVAAANSTFFFDFEDGSLEAFDLIEKDTEVSGFQNHTRNWEIEVGSGTDESNALVSFSYLNGKINNANNIIVTKEYYNITSTSKLSFDAKCFSAMYPDHVKVAISADGENFTYLETVTPNYGSYANVTIDLGAKLTELGVAYGSYQIALHHEENDKMWVMIDNLKLNDGSMRTREAEPQIKVSYPAGKYYLVAAAEDQFTVNVSLDVAPPATPVSFIATAVDQTTVVLSWEAVEGIDAYNIYQAGEVLATVEAGVTEYTIENLEPNTTYCYSITADKNGIESLKTEVACAKTLDYMITAPVVVLEAIDAYTLKLSLEAVEYAQSYNVYIFGELFENMTETVLVIEDLEPSTEYCFEVTALRNEQETEKVLACAYTSSINFEDENLPTEFLYDFNDQSLSEFRMMDVDGDGYNWGVSPATAGYDNTAAIRSYSYSGNALFPDNYIYTKNPYRIKKTSVITLNAKCGNGMDTDLGEHYAVVLSENGTDWYTVFEETIEHADWTNTYVSLAEYAGKGVLVGIRHYNCSGYYFLAVDNFALTVLPEVPAAPVVLAEAISDSTIVLTWDAVENATSYNVYSVATITVGEEEIATSQLVANVTETTYTVENLVAETEYCYAVVALNGELESEASEVVCATTLEIVEVENFLICERFENYEEGDKIAEKGAEYWTTWSAKEGGNEDGEVVVLDGNKCAYFKSGNDQVIRLGGYTSGCYEVEFDVYVPDGKSGYYNFLHNFSGASSSWAMQGYLHMIDNGTTSKYSAGHGSVHAGGVGVADLACIYDAWMHFRFVINIDSDVAEFYCTMPEAEETKVVVWQWSKDSYDEITSPNRKLDAINFYPPLATSEFYLDNLTLKSISGETTTEVTVAEEITASAMVDDLSSVEMTIENTGTSIIDYTAWIDYGVSESGSKVTFINYDNNISDNTIALGISGIAEPTTIEIGAMYPASAYANSVAGTKITHVSYPFVELVENGGYGIVEGSDIVFRIYGQGYNGQPGECLAEKAVPYSAIKSGEFLSAKLDEPVVLTGFNVWATVSFVQPVSTQENPQAPLVFDGMVENLAPYGDVIRLGNTGSFYLANELFQASYGNVHIRVTCSGNPVLGGWAELEKVDGIIPIGETATMNIKFNTFGLKYGETYEAKLILDVNNIDELFEIPLTLYIWGENVNEILSNAYNIYPNPTTAQVTVEGENISYIAVYNSVGQLVKVVNTQSNVVDMSANENGVYFFNIVDNAGQSSVQRVVVAK